MGIRMVGRRRDAQALRAAGNGRIIDRLDVDAVPFEQDVAGALAEFRVADKDRHDMRGVRHHRNFGGGQGSLGARHLLLLQPALVLRIL